MQTDNGDVVIEYETFGRTADPALLLVNGLGSQMIAYRDEMCAMFADDGWFVIRYDNRDVGLSSKTQSRPPSLKAVRRALAAGDPSPAAYSIRDMAADGMAVLDAVGVDEAHVWGMSMGGMIVQTMSYEFTDRVRSVTSVMSTTGARDVGQATPEANEALMEPYPAERDAYIEEDLRRRQIYGSRGLDIDELRTYVAAQYDRCHHPLGVAHQFAAVVADGDRTERLGSVDLPFTVLHGEVDTLIDPSGGRATAAAVDDAELVMYPDMGHDLPQSLWPDYLDQLNRLAKRAG